MPLGNAGIHGAGAHDGALRSPEKSGRLVLNAVDVSATIPDAANPIRHHALSPGKHTSVFVLENEKDVNPDGVDRKNQEKCSTKAFGF
jgi:hypothetical protein